MGNAICIHWRGDHIIYRGGRYHFDKRYRNVSTFFVDPKITSIDKNAFYFWISLRKITVPPTIESVGRRAFIGCSSLTVATLPSTVSSVEDFTFCFCSSLTTVNLRSSITAIGKGAFSMCKALTTIDLPPSITTIGDCAFEGCASLTTINLPSCVTTIGDQTFWGCSSLHTICLPSSVTTIGTRSFEYCSSLTTINLPDAVTAIGRSAFAFCRALSTITLPPDLVSIGSHTFLACTSLVSVHFRADPPYILKSMFERCDTSIAITTPSFSTSSIRDDRSEFHRVLLSAGYSPYEYSLLCILYDVTPRGDPPLGAGQHDDYFNLGRWARTRSREDGRLPLCGAVAKSVEWKGVRRIFAANMPAVREVDGVTGFPLFMLAAVGERGKLESVYGLLREYPTAMEVYGGCTRGIEESGVNMVRGT